MSTRPSSINFYDTYEKAHPKKIKSLCQSIFAILKQFVHLSLPEELLDFAATLLRVNKGMDLVEGPRACLA
jgi:hypothetical protein